MVVCLTTDTLVPYKECHITLCCHKTTTPNMQHPGGYCLPQLPNNSEPTPHAGISYLRPPHSKMAQHNQRQSAEELMRAPRNATTQFWGWVGQRSSMDDAPTHTCRRLPSRLGVRVLPYICAHPHTHKHVPPAAQTKRAVMHSTGKATRPCEHMCGRQQRSGRTRVPSACVRLHEQLSAVCESGAGNNRHAGGAEARLDNGSINTKTRSSTTTKEISTTRTHTHRCEQV